MPLFGRNELNPDVTVKQIDAGLNHFAAITSQYKHLFIKNLLLKIDIFKNKLNLYS